MSYILASIAASTLILVLFRWMQHSSAVTRHAIVVGYLVSAVAGSVLLDVDWSFSADGWFWPAALEGVGFYVVFRLMAKTTELNGMTVVSIATKMSVVIPALIGILALGESISVLKITGLLVGLLAVVLAAGAQVKVAAWLLPVLVFFGTGLIDASFKLFQVWGLADAQFPGFIVTVFGFAFATSVAHHLFLPDRLINQTSMAAGVVLGLANMGTVLFMLKALAQPGWESSIVYPLNNFGGMLAAILTAIFVFSEKPNTKTKLSFCAAAVSMGLLYAAR